MFEEGVKLCFRCVYGGGRGAVIPRFQVVDVCVRHFGFGFGFLQKMREHVYNIFFYLRVRL